MSTRLCAKCGKTTRLKKSVKAAGLPAGEDTTAPATQAERDALGKFLSKKRAHAKKAKRRPRRGG